tara:strand:+ start:13588 stop:15255 length:1668 start_codon:yes stop_codon:yes gene_type:complete
MDQLIECVPNFSEGRDPAVLDKITSAIQAVEGVWLLDVDPGAATNRTVVTFVGAPAAVIEAAVIAGRVSAELIDMSRHHGEHPRFGAMDVCPLIPIANITMDETAEHARELARRLGEEVGLTVYCYENAATRPERRNLAVVRKGEYEALEARLAKPEHAPDFGPAKFQPRTGATAVGARDFLVAYNVNLNTTSTRRANAIAFDVREKGRVKREPDPVTGKAVLDADGNEVWIPGALKCCKGIGWFIEEYGVAQISMNLTNINVTPMHVAFDTCDAKAQERGIRVTGSEAVGMLPLASLLDAGRYFLAKQQRSTGVSDRELIHIAVKSMGLDELAPFVPEEKIIEYAIAARSRAKRLVDLSLVGFIELTASESPAPGGGSVAAALGALGAALGTMVANLSSHKRGWDDRWQEFSEWAEKGKVAQMRLVSLIDEDTQAFNQIMDAWRADADVREERIQAATRNAIEIPLQVMETALASLEVSAAMADIGMAASASDAAVGALCARAAVRGAGMNVRINAKDLKDDAARKAYLDRAATLEQDAAEQEAKVLASIETKL